MRKTLELLSLGAILLLIGTGLYTQLPGVAYIFVLYAWTLLVFDKRFLRKPLQYIEPNMLKGYGLFNSFLLIQIFFGQLELRVYFFAFFAMSLMILAYALTKLVVYRGKAVELRWLRYLGVVVFFALLLLLASQIAQIAGYIKQVNLEGGETDALITLARPGGFLNPNVTAAIAITLLFTLERLGKVIGNFFLSMALPVAISVILMTQSRAALITMIGFLLMVVFRYSFRQMMPLLSAAFVIVSFISIIYSDDAISLFGNAMQRFEGDASSAEREHVLRFSFDAFGDSPMFGHGSTYLVAKLGVSSHNQLVEFMVSYGLLGLLVMTYSLFLLYLPSSALLIVFCILPMFLFSHNFVDSYAYQMGLGIALAVDRIVRDTLHNSNQIQP